MKNLGLRDRIAVWLCLCASY